MEIRRFFAEEKDKIDNKIILRENQAKHISKVLRLKLGFSVIVSLNDGIDYYSKIKEINKDNVVLEIEKEVKNETKMKKSITLFQAIPKKDKLDFIIQKSTELGIDRIVFFQNSYSQEYKSNIDREKEIIISAAKQCGRARLTEISEKIKLEDIKKYKNEFDRVFVFYENEKENTIYSIEEELKNIDKIAIIIGSEGGFKKEEIDFLVKELGAKSISLGKRILRCETATITALSIVSYLLGEMI